MTAAQAASWNPIRRSRRSTKFNIERDLARAVLEFLAVREHPLQGREEFDEPVVK